MMSACPPGDVAAQHAAAHACPALQLVEAGKVEEARAACAEQMEEAHEQLKGDDAFRAEYFALWETQRKQPVHAGERRLPGSQAALPRPALPAQASPAAGVQACFAAGRLTGPGSSTHGVTSTGGCLRFSWCRCRLISTAAPLNKCR